MKSLLGTLALTAYLGLTAPAYAQQPEWQIGAAPNEQAQTTIPIDPEMQSMDRFLNYTTFLGERIVEVRDISDSYRVNRLAQKGDQTRKLAQEVKQLNQTLNGLEFATIEVEKESQLDKFLKKYQKDDSAKKTGFPTSKPRYQPDFDYTPLTCAKHLEYDKRLAQIEEEVQFAKLAVARSEPEILQSDLAKKFDSDLSHLLKTTKAQADRFDLENNCGGI